jgi:hypothetical protein
MSNRSARSFAVLAAVAALGLGSAVPMAVAKHGADDPVGHDAGDDHGGKRVRAKPARHSGDDRGRHHRRGHHRHGSDDGPNHT